MCVRCGTGRIAWCTHPTKHGDLPIRTEEGPKEAIITFVTTDSEGTPITKVYRVDYESEQHFDAALMVMSRSSGVMSVEQLTPPTRFQI